MQFPTITPPTPPPLVEQIAENLFAHLSPEVERRKSIHRQLYQGFWCSPVSPDDILSELSSHVVELSNGTQTTRAALMLQMANENLSTLSNIAGYIGGTLDDLIPAEEYAAKRQFIPHEDGTVTLAPPAEGYDAWGNQLSTPDPEI